MKKFIIVMIVIILIGINNCFGLDIEKDVLPIIAQAESSNNPNAIGDNGNSIGLYQVSKKVIYDYQLAHLPKEYTKNLKEGTIIYDVINPNINREIAFWFIRHSIIPALKENSYPIDTAHIIFCYNYGIDKLKQTNGKIPNYTKKHPNKIYRKIYVDYFNKQ